MSTKRSQNNKSIITSYKVNSNETKYLNKEVDDKVQKIQESQDDDDEDLSDLANGGWEDDFTDNEEEDAENRKEWETLEFLCNISKTNPYKDGNNDVKKNGFDIDVNDDYNYDDNCDDGSNDNDSIERNGMVKDNKKDNKNIDNKKNNKNNKNNEKNKNTKNNEKTKNNKNSKIKDNVSCTNNIKQPLSIPKSNRKKRSSANDNEIGVGTLYQKAKRPKDDRLEIQKSP